MDGMSVTQMTEFLEERGTQSSSFEAHLPGGGWSGIYQSSPPGAPQVQQLPPHLLAQQRRLRDAQLAQWNGRGQESPREVVAPKTRAQAMNEALVNELNGFRPRSWTTQASYRSESGTTRADLELTGAEDLATLSRK